MAQMASQASGEDTISESVFADLDQDGAEARSQLNETRTMGHVVQTDEGDLVFEFEHDLEIDDGEIEGLVDISGKDD